MTYILATVDTGNFEWTALGDSERQCNVALHNAYADHARSTPGSETDLMRELIQAGEVDYAEIDLGVALRDGSRVPPSSGAGIDWERRRETEVELEDFYRNNPKPPNGGRWP